MFVLSFLVTLLLLLIYLNVKKCHSYWKIRGIPTLKPRFLLGNMYESLRGRENVIESIIKSYTQFKHYKYVGYYKCLSPALIVNDPELIGKVLVQDFHHFEDNTIEVTEEADILMAKNLFTLKGHQWKSIKQLMTPMFTSSKMRLVFPLISESCQKLVRYIHKQIDEDEKFAFDGKYLTHQYTTENVANCVFGIEAKAFEDEKSEFVKVASIFGTPSFFQSLQINLILLMPFLNKVFSLRFFSKYVQNYLIDVVTQTLRYRKENNLIRNDFLDMIGDLKIKSKEYLFNDKDVTAQAASFFGDGIETSAIVMSFNLFQIAQHPEIQDQLRNEIKTVIHRHHNEISYEALRDMHFMDCVMNETMRLNVPLMVMFKSCTKTYEFPPPIEGVPGIKVHPGDAILIPVEGLHRDERYYIKPEKFQPERFDNKNRESLHNYTYLPFGEGPRICVGMRFGVLQIKAALVHIILNFQVKIDEKMQVPLQLEPNTFLRMPLGGFWFNFEKI